jgi:hypothetical protein
LNRKWSPWQRWRTIKLSNVSFIVSVSSRGIDDTTSEKWEVHYGWTFIKVFKIWICSMSLLGFYLSSLPQAPHVEITRANLSSLCPINSIILNNYLITIHCLSYYNYDQFSSLNLFILTHMRGKRIEHSLSTIQTRINFREFALRVMIILFSSISFLILIYGKFGSYN